MSVRCGHPFKFTSDKVIQNLVDGIINEIDLQVQIGFDNREDPDSLVCNTHIVAALEIVKMHVQSQFTLTESNNRER